MNKTLLCCDWGTSSFRLRIVDTINYSVIAGTGSKEGISVVFNAWKAGEAKDRQAFYIDKLKAHIQNLSALSGIDLNNIPVVLSGMASSSIGMEEIPYADLPFCLDGSGARTRKYAGVSGFNHELLLVSGVKSNRDVMRGEEAQLIGLYHLDEIEHPAQTEKVFVFPGTHSKHIYTSGSHIVDFQTYMTGEIFNLMSSASILKDSVSLSGDLSLSDLANAEAFRLGVKASGDFSILHSLFTVRTNQLFNKLDKGQNAVYMSGLLIGTELRSLKNRNVSSIVICSGAHLYENYKIAATEIDLKGVTFIDSNLIDKATIAGQVQLFKNSIHA